MSPRTPGPGPSVVNHSAPSPPLPRVTISPEGMTHSTPSMFRAWKPMDAPVMPYPHAAAVEARIEWLPPHDTACTFRPTFQSSVWRSIART